MSRITDFVKKGMEAQEVVDKTIADAKEPTKKTAAIEDRAELSRMTIAEAAPSSNPEDTALEGKADFKFTCPYCGRMMLWTVLYEELKGHGRSYLDGAPRLVAGDRITFTVNCKCGEKIPWDLGLGDGRYETVLSRVQDRMNTFTEFALWLAEELDRTRAETMRLRQDRMNAFDVRASETYCAYCGKIFLRDDDAATKISKHIRTCLKHPMRQVEQDRDEARAQLADLKRALQDAKDARPGEATE